jgi:hypothetical protein
MSRPKGAKNISTLQVKRIAQSIIHDPGYLAGLKRRIMNGRAPHMEQLLFYYAHGKPTESLKVEATLNVIVSHAADEFRARLLGARPVPTFSRPALPDAAEGGTGPADGHAEHNGSGGATV